MAGRVLLMRSDNFLVHHALICGGSSKPARWMLVLHGIFGSGSNFRTIAKALCERCPSWGFILADLRCHGQSQGAPPPHSVASAAQDLLNLNAVLPARPDGVMGHSFGGKVALAYADLCSAQTGGLSHVIVLDSSAGANVSGLGRSQGMAVLQMLEQLEMPIVSREFFIAFVRSHGYSKAIADWLAMNVRRAGDGLRLRADLPSIRALLEDYFALDLWPVIENRKAKRFDIVLGANSTALSEQDRHHFEMLSHVDSAFHLHMLANAGHWLHADNPEGLLDILAKALNASSMQNEGLNTASTIHSTGDHQ